MRIEIDFSELEGFEHWAATQPRLLRKATGQLLSDLAAGTRLAAIGVLNDELEVRNERFVRGRLRFSKAKQSAPTNRQEAEAGSVSANRFDGWSSMYEPSRDTRTRTATLLARSGSEKKQMRHAVRLKPRNQVVTREQYGMGRGTGYTVRQFFAAAHRKKENKLIRVGKVILKRKRSKFQPVQILSRPKAPRQLRWLHEAQAVSFRRNSPQSRFSRIIRQVMTAPRKR